MRKLLISFAFFIYFAHSWSLVERDLSKRANDPVCQTKTSVCSDVGGICPTCQDCSEEYQKCISAPYDPVSRCNCFSDYVNCAAAKKTSDGVCDSVSLYKNCQSSFTNCSCGTPYTGPLTSYDCKPSTWCNKNTSTCVALKTAGQACLKDEECGDGTNSYIQNEYKCTSGKCTITNRYYPGAACSVDTDCEYFASYGIGCRNGTCRSLSVGATCKLDEYACGSKYYCSITQSCKTVSAVGGPCDIFTACPLGYTCDKSVCVKQYSKAIGDNCDFSSSCTQPAYCSDTTGKCAQLLPEVNCTTDAFCKNLNSDYEGCLCDGDHATCQTDSFVTSNYCTDELAALGECLRSSGCAPAFEFIPGCCLLTHCKSELDSIISCSKSRSSCVDFGTTGGGGSTNGGSTIGGVTNTAGTGSSGTESSNGRKEAGLALLIGALIALSC